MDVNVPKTSITFFRGSRTLCWLQFRNASQEVFGKVVQGGLKSRYIPVRLTISLMCKPTQRGKYLSHYALMHATSRASNGLFRENQVHGFFILQALMTIALLRNQLFLLDVSFSNLFFFQGCTLIILILFRSDETLRRLKWLLQMSPLSKNSHSV